MKTNVSKQRVIDTVKMSITIEELNFRGPRLLNMWLKGRIYLPEITPASEDKLKRLAFELKGTETFNRDLYIYDAYMKNIVKRASEKLDCQVDFKLTAESTVKDLCDCFLKAMEHKLTD